MAVTPAEAAGRKLYAQLQAGDRVEVTHEVIVGSSKRWHTKTVGTVVGKDRRRHGLAVRRASDDKVYSDELVLRRDDGELTTVTMDEFTSLVRLS